MNLTHVDSNKRFTSSTVVFYVVCFLLAIAKIIIVSHEEIIARNLPHDDLWHILAAARGYWLGSGYTNMTFIHLPVYPLWVAIVYFTGVPLRVATELLFLFSGFLLVLSFYRADVNKTVCTVAYGLIIFHPVSFQLFNYNLAETLYASLFILALAAMIMMWIHRGQKPCLIFTVFFGVFSSLLWNLRKENLLILGLILLISFLAFIALSKEGHNWRSIVCQLSILTLLPLSVILIVTLTFKVINYKKFGLFASTEMSAPGYTAAYKALLRIKPPSSIRFIPVTTEVRKAAYAVSPAFKELEPFLERESGFGKFETEKYMGIKGEIAAGWFYWVLRDAAALAGHHTSALEAEAYYQRVADEINAAIDSGRLPGRLVVMTFLDPMVSNYLPYLPDSLFKMWMLFTSSQQQSREKEAVDLTHDVRKAFDIVTNRRTALTQYDVVIMQGWAFFQDTKRMKRVLLKSASGATLGVCDSFVARADVAKSYLTQGVTHVSVNTGFTLTATQAGQQLDNAQLVFIGTDDKELTVPYKTVVIGKPFSLVSSDAKQGITFALDSSDTPKILAFRNSAQSIIWSAYGKFVAVLTYIGIASLLTMLLIYKSIDFKENIYPIMLLILFAVLTRVFLFSLLDSSSWPGNQPRYLFPVMPLYTCFLLLLTAQAGKAFYSWSKKRRNLNLNGER